jgi:hypothetical protein
VQHFLPGDSKSMHETAHRKYFAALDGLRDKITSPSNENKICLQTEHVENSAKSIIGLRSVGRSHRVECDV